MKEYSSSLNVSPISQTTKDTDTVVYSNDIESFRFSFNLLDDNDNKYELTDVSDVSFVLVFGGRKLNIYPKATLVGQIDSIEDGTISLLFPKRFLGFLGDVYAEINLSYSDGRALTVGRFKFRMKQSYINEGTEIEEQVYVQQFEEVKKDVQEQKEVIKALVNEAREKVESIQQDIDMSDFVTKEVFEATNREIDKKISDAFQPLNDGILAIYKDLENKPNNDALVGIRDWLQKQIDEVRNTTNELRNDINQLKP